MTGAPTAPAAVRNAVISHAAPDEIPAIVNFTHKARTDMFPMIDTQSHRQHANKSLATFQHTYLDHPHGAFLTARVDGVLVATIGYVPYDYRFSHLRLGEGHIVEVIRLYVDPEFRRTGLASRLFAALETTARERGICRLYLHTHPFLPGAVSFWERHGFYVIHQDSDPAWRTVHMSVGLEETIVR